MKGRAIDMTRWSWSVIATAAIPTLLSVVAILPAAAGASGDPLAGAPAVGECRDYTAETRRGWNDDSAPVSCDDRHTALVVKVASAPSKYDLSGKPSTQLLNFASDTCLPAWRSAVGVTHAQRHLVAYTYSWFAPTKAQLAQGARWIRCDVNIDNGEKLGRLPSRAPFVEGDIDRIDRKCLNGKRLVVSCANPHEWISRGLVTVPKGPFSIQRQDSIARRRCTSTLKRSDRRYLWSRISESSWRAGERHIVCFGNG